MKRLFLALALIFAVGNVCAADGDILADKLFAPEIVPLRLMDFDLSGVSKPNFKASLEPRTAAEMNPGKALLLSAILPGAGEFYAGNKIKAGIFFGIELLSWGGVIYFYGQGMDKEDEFIEFADLHFDESAYRTYEFSLAQDPVHGDSMAYPGDFATWTDELWNTKIHYLPSAGFTHELPTQMERDNDWSQDQQYYEMIGKYIHQFGFGWDDGIEHVDSTAHFNGYSPNSEDYMDMRHESNKLLEYSAWGYNIALLNHVASALDASFTVRVAKRKAKAELGFRQVPYDREIVNAAGLRITW